MNIILIGAGGRIGSNLALHLLSKGYNLAIGDLDINQIKSKIDNLYSDKQNIFFKKIDMTSEDKYNEWLKEAFDHLGSIDGAINCSYPKGKNYGRNLEEVNLHDFNNNVSIHLGSYFNFLNLTSRFMKINKLEGSIVSISSIYGVIPPKFDIYDGTKMTMPVEYAAVKSSINHLVKYFAKFYSGIGLRFNSVCPGGILDNQPISFVNAYKKYSLSKGMLDTDDVLPLIEFLVSNKSAYINGENITIDDGFSL